MGREKLARNPKAVLLLKNISLMPLETGSKQHSCRRAGGKGPQLPLARESPGACWFTETDVTYTAPFMRGHQ